jgi:hypothetical protein
VRRAIVGWFGDQNVDMGDVRRKWFQRNGYGDVSDVVEDVRHRWDDVSGDVLFLSVEREPSVARWESDEQWLEAATKIVPLHVPEPLYLDYLELAIEAYANDREFVPVEAFVGFRDPYEEPVRYLNDLFAVRRIDYRFDERGRAEWHGDEGAYHEVLRPALDVLDDPRLGTSRREFGDALDAVRRGDRVGVKNAIRDASNAVESAMKALLDARGVPRPERETADPLWDALRRGGVVAEKTKEEICGPSHLRNSYGGHGADPARDEPVPDGVASLAVMTAAAAIVYLAGRLP